MLAMNNVCVWFEIPVLEMERARKFYSEVMNIEMPVETMNDAEMAFFPMEEGGNSGALVKYEQAKPSHDGPVIYLNGGDDLDAFLRRVEPAGGKVIMPKTMISEEIGFMAFFLDTEGNRLAFWSQN